MQVINGINLMVMLIISTLLIQFMLTGDVPGINLETGEYEDFGVPVQLFC